MKHKILPLIILLAFFVSSYPIVKASKSDTIMPIADTYVDAWEATQSHGDRDYLEVSEYANGLSIALLMFDISSVLDVPSEVKLRLYCFHVPSPHVVGVHWCVNNTWNEENLTFTSFGGFFKTDPGDFVTVDSIDVWYEWRVTSFISKAIEENYEKITLTLEVIPPSKGISRFASKDQQWQEYSPQLVFTHLDPEANSLDTIILVGSGLTVTVAIIFLAYKFSKTSHRKARSKSHPRGRQKRTHEKDA